MMWVVTLRYSAADIDRSALESWEEELVDLDASAGQIPGTAATLTIYVEAGDPVAAVGVAAAAARPVTGLAPIAVEAVDEETYLDQADLPNLPQLVSAAEVADRLEISRQRVHQLQNTGGFPEPLYRLRTGPVWDIRAIDAFATRWDRRPGRRVAEVAVVEPQRVSDLKSRNRNSASPKPIRRRRKA